MHARTLNTTAKSSFSQPMPLAVKNSLVTAVDQALSLGARAVVSGDGVTFFEQARNHVATHYTEAYKSEIYH